MTTSARFQPPPAASPLIAAGRAGTLLDGALGARLTTLVAPPGFGKTTAMASWARTKTREGAFVSWLTLTAGLDEPALFAAALVRSLRTVLPDLPIDAGDDWPEFEQLAARLVTVMDGSGEPTVSVIDSFDNAPGARAAARCLVDMAPDSWHFVIAARIPPFDGLGGLRAAGQLVEIGAQDLRFDSGEIAEILAAMGLDPENTTLVESITGGWPIAVLETCAHVQSAHDRGAAMASIASLETVVGRDVAAEAVRVLSPAARTILADAALLRNADGEAWAAVAGDASGAAAYRDAVAAQLVVPVDDRWYRAHPPLQHVLSADLARDDERRSRVYGRAARWAAEAGLAEDAVTYAFAGGDEAYGTALVADYAQRFTGRGHPHRLLRLIDALDDTLARRPEIVAQRGWAAVLAGDLEELAAVVGEIDEHLEGVPGPTQRLAGGVFRTALHLLRGEASEALATGRAMTEGLDRRAPRLEPGAVDPGWAWAFFAAAAAMAGDFELAQDAARVVVEGGFLGQPLILGAGVQAIIELYWAEPEKAAGLARLAMSVADAALDVDLPVCAPALYVLAHDEDPVEAARALARLRKLAGDAPSPYVDVLVLLAETAQAARDGQDFDEVRASAAAVQSVAATQMQGVPGLTRFVGGIENQIAAAAAMTAIGNRLSDAESAVLRLMGEQLTRREIGAELGISLNTVKFHARSVLRKLGAISTLEAVERGRQLGLLPKPH